MRKKLLALLLCLCMAATFLPGTALAEDVENNETGTIVKEETGTNITWTLDKTTGHLSITGTGPIPNYSSNYNSTKSPWTRDDIKSVEINSGITAIGDDAFFQCSMTSVTIPETVTSVGRYVFYACENLASVNIPSKLTTIGHGMFRGCTSLISITIPETVTCIGNEAFYESGLTSITIPKSVTSFDLSEEPNLIFVDCQNLTAINVAEDNPNYSSANGVLFNKDKTTLIAYPAGKADAAYTIPGTVTAIGYEAFSRAKLTSVVIPDSVTSMGSGAFSGSSLTSVTIPGSITSIGQSPFSGCYSLTSVVITEGLKSISNGAFFDCTNLASVTIPTSVTYIGGFAFSNCDSLKAAYYAGSEDDWKKVSFGPIGENETDDGKVKLLKAIQYNSTGEDTHTHNGGDTWKSDEMNHWHECTAEGCDLTGTPKKYDSAAHVYTDDADTTCNVCGYEREVTTDPDAPAISNISYNYSTGALTWTGKNIPETNGDSNEYFWIQTFDSEGNEVAGSGKECMETNVKASGIQVTKSGDTYSCTYKPVTLADGNYKIRIECRIPGGSTVSYSFTLPQSTTPVDPDPTPDTPSSGGGSYTPPSSTTTETTTNPDGSTTTKTENKTTGTVTETTKNPDGSQTRVETKKDGTVTTTETDKEGNKSETVAKPDGSSVTKVNQKDGAAATVNTDTEGKVEAEVKLPEKAVAAAQEGSSVIALPIPEVKDTKSTETAPAVTVKTGSKDPVKVEIPTSGVTPGTVAVILKEDGTEEIVKTSVATEAGLVVALPDGATVKIVDNSKTFADVPADNWAADAVSFSAARELFSGTGENTFSPETTMTRGMLMTVLANLDGEDTSGGETWYEKGMDWAAANGVSDGSDPDGSVTREQMITMIWRYMGSPAASGTIDRFADADSVSSYCADAMNWAASTGLIKGSDDNALVPQGIVTRAQVAQLLKNFIEMQ